MGCRKQFAGMLCSVLRLGLTDRAALHLEACWAAGTQPNLLTEGVGSTSLAATDAFARQQQTGSRTSAARGSLTSTCTCLVRNMLRQCRVCRCYVTEGEAAPRRQHIHTLAGFRM